RRRGADQAPLGAGVRRGTAFVGRWRSAAAPSCSSRTVAGSWTTSGCGLRPKKRGSCRRVPVSPAGQGGSPPRRRHRDERALSGLILASHEGQELTPLPALDELTDLFGRLAGALGDVVDHGRGNPGGDFLAVLAHALLIL